MGLPCVICLDMNAAPQRRCLRGGGLPRHDQRAAVRLQDGARRRARLDDVEKTWDVRGAPLHRLRPLLAGGWREPGPAAAGRRRGR